MSDGPPSSVRGRVGSHSSHQSSGSVDLGSSMDEGLDDMSPEPYHPGERGPPPVLTVDFESLRAAQSLVATGGSPRKPSRTTAEAGANGGSGSGGGGGGGGGGAHAGGGATEGRGPAGARRRSSDSGRRPGGMARLPLSGTDSDDSFEIGSDNEDGGARGGAAEGNEGWDENMLNFEDNVDEYELEDLYGQAHRIRQRLFQAQQELAKAEEARQRAFRKVFSLRNELISCVNAEGGDVSTVDIVGGSAMIHKMPNTPLVAKATAQASAAATSLKAAASVASEQFPELSDALASAATVVEHAVEKRLGNRAKGRGSERDNLDSDQTNESGQENPSSGASTPADSSANGATNNNTTKQHVDTNVESEAADSEGSTATPTSGSGRRRSSATSRPRDSMLGDGLKIDSVTREIDADSLDTRIFRQGIILFNISARKGIDYMVR